MRLQTEEDLENWRKAAREHERELRRIGKNSQCQAGCTCEDTDAAVELAMELGRDDIVAYAMQEAP